MRIEINMVLGGIKAEESANPVETAVYYVARPPICSSQVGELSAVHLWLRPGSPGGGSQLQLVAEGLLSLIDESIKLSPESICSGMWNSSKQER